MSANTEATIEDLHHVHENRKAHIQMEIDPSLDTTTLIFQAGTLMDFRHRPT